MQSLTLRFQAEDVGRPGFDKHARGSVDFEVLSKFLPKFLRSLSLRDVILHESNFTKISPKVLRGIRRLRLNYQELSEARITTADTQLDGRRCCFATELFEFVVFNFPSLVWLEIAQARPLGVDLCDNVDGEGRKGCASQDCIIPGSSLEPMVNASDSNVLGLVDIHWSTWISLDSRCSTIKSTGSMWTM